MFPAPIRTMLFNELFTIEFLKYSKASFEVKSKLGQIIMHPFYSIDISKDTFVIVVADYIGHEMGLSATKELATLSTKETIGNMNICRFIVKS